MLLVNFIGEPGKPTAAAGLFYRLKTFGFDVEFVTGCSPEQKVSEGAATPGDGLQAFAEKYRRIKRYENADLVLSDSPLISGIVYGSGHSGDEAAAFYRRVAQSFDSIYVVVRPAGPDVAFGGAPDEAGAKQAHTKIVDCLESMRAPRIYVDGCEREIDRIVGFVMQQTALRNTDLTGDAPPAQAQAIEEHRAR